MSDKKKTLYERLGGYNAIAAFADDLLPQIKATADIAEPLIAQDQYNKEAALGVELIQQGAAFEKAIGYFRMNLPENLVRLILRIVQEVVLSPLTSMVARLLKSVVVVL